MILGGEEMKRTRIALGAAALMLLPTQVAHAGTLETQGVTVSWSDVMYKAAKFKCNVYYFDYYNGVGFDLLQVSFDVLDPYGGRVAWDSAIGVPNRTSGTWDLQICDHQFTNGAGPYTFKLTIKDYSNNTQSKQAQYTFLEPPTSPSPSPSPTPTQPTPPVSPVTPQTQQVTGVPAKVKVGKKVRLPRSSSAGIPIGWSASPKRVCKLSGSVVKGRKKGCARCAPQCRESPCTNPWPRRSRFV